MSEEIKIIEDLLNIDPINMSYEQLVSMQNGWWETLNLLSEQNKENKRLNNIINELEKELREDYKIWMCDSRSNGKSVKFGIDVCKTHFYNRLRELKRK